MLGVLIKGIAMLNITLLFVDILEICEISVNMRYEKKKEEPAMGRDGVEESKAEIKQNKVMAKKGIKRRKKPKKKKKGKDKNLPQDDIGISDSFQFLNPVNDTSMMIEHNNLSKYAGDSNLNNEKNNNIGEENVEKSEPTNIQEDIKVTITIIITISN